MPPSLTPLPIDARMRDIVDALRSGPSLVLVAEPGAGKTTRVPRGLLDAGFAERGEIVVLEPRRLATRMAATRVAEELGERAGERVGYQVRFEDVSSRQTRVRFLTEGILTRRLATDPVLSGISVVVLDEFHERHLHADVALTFVQRLQRGPRPDLKLVVMSATIDAARVAAHLGCAHLHVEGRTFPVEIEHTEKPDDRPLDVRVAAALRKVVARGVDGDTLVFLPGAADIRRAQDACAQIAASNGLDLVPLHGELPAREQDRAVSPGPRPKVILSTNVAETSLTIPGVTTVIDSGLAKIAGNSPWTGMPTLETTPISRASATQRAGRAGRVRAGRCLRLFTKHDFDGRREHDVPEIQRLDLAETLLLLLGLGEREPASLPWLDAPQPAAVARARALLSRLGAIGVDGALTATGKRLLALPLHPRAGRLVLDADARGAGARGALIAALISERDVLERRRFDDGGRGRNDEVGRSDAVERLAAIETYEARGGRPQSYGLDAGALQSVLRVRDQLARAARVGRVERHLEDDEEALLLATLAAFPDRVGKRRTANGADVVFAQGGSGKLAPESVVREAAWLVALDADEKRGATTIRAASAIEPEWLLELFPDHVTERHGLVFDAGSGRVLEEHALVYESIALDESRKPAAASPDVSALLAREIRARGLGSVCDVDALEQLKRRLALASAHTTELSPLDDAALDAALTALCDGATSLHDVRGASLLDVLTAELGAKNALLERLAPTHVLLPRGRRVRIEYEPEQPPWIASRLQDFFGAQQGPVIAGGRVPLVLHLLAPNQRPVQVTTDLAGFWQRHYPSIRRELMRRYPRHAWPEDPTIPLPEAPPRR